MKKKQKHEKIEKKKSIVDKMDKMDSGLGVEDAEGSSED